MYFKRFSDAVLETKRATDKQQIFRLTLLYSTFFLVCKMR